MSKSQYQFALQSPDTNELYRYASVLEAKMRQMPNLQDVSSDLQIKNPQVNIEINRDKASALGVTAQQIEGALSTAYASRQISTILTPNNQYQVIMELRAAVPDGYFRPLTALYPVLSRQTRPIEYRGQSELGVRPPVREPSGAESPVSPSLST